MFIIRSRCTSCSRGKKKNYITKKILSRFQCFTDFKSVKKCSPAVHHNARKEKHLGKGKNDHIFPPRPPSRHLCRSYVSTSMFSVFENAFSDRSYHAVRCSCFRITETSRKPILRDLGISCTARSRV